MSTTDESGIPTGRAEITLDPSGVPVVELIGEIDLSNVDAVRASIEPTVERMPERIVFELAALDVLDSSGIALLLYVAAKIGSVEIRHPSEIVRRVVEVTGLAELLHMEA